MFTQVFLACVAAHAAVQGTVGVINSLVEHRDEIWDGLKQVGSGFANVGRCTGRAVAAGAAEVATSPGVVADVVKKATRRKRAEPVQVNGDEVVEA